MARPAGERFVIDGRNRCIADVAPKNLSGCNGSKADHHLPQATPRALQAVPRFATSATRPPRHGCPHPLLPVGAPRATMRASGALRYCPDAPIAADTGQQPPSYVAEPRHCRHLVGVRWRIALKHMGFQHQRTKSSLFVFGIGSVTGIAPQKTVRILSLPEAPCWTVNP